MTEHATSILVVEDDARVRSELVSIVEQFGTAVEAASYAEAAQLLTSGSYGLILVDLALPDGSGLDLFELLPSLDASPAVVVVSSTLNIVARNQSLARGAADFISKPFQPAELSRRLHRALSSHKRATAFHKRAIASHQRAQLSGNAGLDALVPESTLSRLSPGERAVLSALAERPRTPVPLNELAKGAGIHGILAGSRLRRIVRRLRRRLGDDPRNPRIIVDSGGETENRDARIMFIPFT